MSSSTYIIRFQRLQIYLLKEDWKLKLHDINQSNCSFIREDVLFTVLFSVGIHCEECKTLYFRKPDISLDATDVCTPCNCRIAGVVNGTKDCEKVNVLR